MLWRKVKSAKKKSPLKIKFPQQCHPDRDAAEGDHECATFGPHDAPRRKNGVSAIGALTTATSWNPRRDRKRLQSTWKWLKENIIQYLCVSDVIDEDEDYKYLRSMRIEQVEEENIKKLRDERDSKIKELDILKKTTPEDMWDSELNTLLIQYKLYRQNRINRNKGLQKGKRIIKKKKIKAKIKKNK